MENGTGNWKNTIGKIMKIRAQRGPKSRTSGSGGGRGLFFGPAARRRNKFWKTSAKDGTKTLKVTPKMRQDGAKMGVLGATCAILARSWLQVGRFGEVLGSLLEVFLDIGGSVKSNNSTAYSLYFEILGGLGGIVFQCCAEVAPRGIKN